MVAGITRYAHNQEALEGRIEALRGEFAKLEAAEDKDFDRMDAVEKELDWSTRIFQDRQQSLTYVCETPVILEQRAFAIGRAVEAALPGAGIGETGRRKKAWALRARRPSIPCISAGGESAGRGGEAVEQRPVRTVASDVARVPSDHAVADVLIVDDHPLMCDALSATLGYAFGLRKVRVAASIAEALESIREEGVPDAVVLDLNLPDAEGVERGSSRSGG